MKENREDTTLIRRGSETGKEAENEVFNIENSKLYDEEKTIRTKATLNALNFTAEEKDIQLITSLRDLGNKLEGKSSDWKHLG